MIQCLYTNFKKVEIIGYIARATAENRTDLLQPYVVQSIFILLAPAFFAATIYMTLGRLMRHLKGERHSIIPVRWLTGAFVGGDIISFFIMGSGAGVMVSGKGTIDTGRKIIIGGFVLQILMMILFMITAIIFHVGMRHWPSGPSLNPRSSWRRSMRMLYVASVLIIARALFRAVEYILGPEGYPLRHEWALCVFDALLMLCVMGVFGCFFPRTGHEADEGNGWQAMDVFHVK